jgi:hypothetical protein
MRDRGRFEILAAIVAVLCVFDSSAAAQQGFVTANKGADSAVILTETAAQTTTSTTYTNLTSTSVTIPAGQTGYILASFTAEASCLAHNRAVCFVRILVDSVEMHPKLEDDDVIFMSSGDRDFESQAIDRISDELPAGPHTVTVQWRTQATGIDRDPVFRLDDWQLKLVVWRKS